MSTLDLVWRAHKTADCLSNSLAFFYEDGYPAGVTGLTESQRQTLAGQLGALQQDLAKVGVVPTS
ncbi:hypothetical protein [Streptomyces sp. CBMA156]|uniref:hypothetical protein n=1 Tax=Streptomyces sp. CBMA156 TaxID=1930280 RepID=UPI001661F758|nr:hypothetical protein [Streptomyces sp. CBMA156]MBD0670034.1 hypothetical protein [Streptomyces sp. CBMA156]